MPTPKAKAAFNEASRIAAEMRTINAKENALNEAIDGALHESLRSILEDQFIRLCAEWQQLHLDFNLAFDEYTAAAE